MVFDFNTLCGVEVNEVERDDGRKADLGFDAKGMATNSILIRINFEIC